VVWIEVAIAEIGIDYFRLRQLDERRTAIIRSLASETSSHQI